MALKHWVIAAMLCSSFTGTIAMAVEEPAYKPVLQEGAFEVRDYAAVVVAEVTVSGEQKEAASKGFRLLAGYIFGGNKQRQSIAMTAPVTQKPNEGQWGVNFTMPSAYNMDTLPQPNDPRVQLRAVPPSRYAVLRFSGLARQDDVANKTSELQRLLASHQLRAIGPASLAQYNPPWTPWFMRRNEVMIPIAP